MNIAELKSYWITQKPKGRSNGKTLWQGIANILNNADYYKWHDLRKNADDLPMKNCYVLVYCEIGNKYSFGTYDGDNLFLCDKVAYYKKDVTAWKYTETFESEE